LFEVAAREFGATEANRMQQ